MPRVIPPKKYLLSSWLSFYHCNAMNLSKFVPKAYVVESADLGTAQNVRFFFVGASMLPSDDSLAALRHRIGEMPMY